MMKKILLTAAFCLASIIGSAQAQIDTKKVKIGDFTAKTTKVVLSGNTMEDSFLKQNMAAHWKISPYEFCTLEEFETLRTSPEYYFLLKSKGQFKKESAPGLILLSVLKGGAAASEGIGGMMEVVNIPICPIVEPSGREYTMFGPILDILQDHIVKSMESDYDGYTGLGAYNINLSRDREPKIVLVRDEISSQLDDKALADLENYNIEVVEDPDEADDYMVEGTPDTFVGYVVYPNGAPNNSWCYKMVIDCETHKLCFYKRHKINKNNPAGFLAEDIKRMKDSRKVE